MRTVVRYVDPVAAMFALATAVGVLIVQEGPLLALVCGASVLVVGAVANVVAHRIAPPKPPEPTPEHRPEPPVAAPASWHYPLTKRQAEVALLLADPGGLSNKDIADQLFISERGVEAMVQVIFNRLSEHTKREFHSRTQVALWVKERMAAHPQAPPEPPARRPVPR
jgi:DNA-binding NarL/FixJ family response regulator